MRYRIDTQHYINDRLLEPGHIIGEGTDVPFIDAKGNPMLPSVNMTPLDDEAKSAFSKAYPGTEYPSRNPTDAIPLTMDDNGMVRQPNNQGTVNTTDGGWVIGPDGEPTNQRKIGLPDANTPNAPVGRPVIGTVPAAADTPTIPAKPEDPAYAVAPQKQAPANHQTLPDSNAKPAPISPRPADNTAKK